MAERLGMPSLAGEVGLSTEAEHNGGVCIRRHAGIWAGCMAASE